MRSRGVETSCTDRLVYISRHAFREGKGPRGDRGSENGRRSRCPMRWSSRTGSPKSATSTRTSTRWRPSCCGLGSGRWRAGSRRSPSRAISSSTRSSTSRSSWCAPTTWGCTPSRTPAGIGASGSSRVAGPARAGFTCPFHGWCYGPDGTNTFVTQGEDASPSTTCSPTTSTSRRCGARCGAGAPGSTSTTTPRRCGSASSRSPPSSTPGRWSRCGPSGGTPAASP